MKGACTINIDDVMQKIELPEEPTLTAIFSHQKELMLKYDVIETKNGYEIPKSPYSIEDTKVQQRIKDMFWRVTEELSEAVETLPPAEKLSEWKKLWDFHPEVRHFFEELADALHFLVEGSIIAGIEPESIQFEMTELLKPPFSSLVDIWLTIPSDISSIVFKMGFAANTLKNKPWKLTQMPTDVTKFKEQLREVWKAFLLLWRHLCCTEKEVYVLYVKKNLVNQWRQKTNY